MIRYDDKSRQLQKNLSLEKLRQIGEDMRAKGHLSLTIDMDRLEKKDLSFLEHFQHLNRLIIRGGTQSQVKKIILVTGIKSLCLIGVKLNDYEFLKHFKNLEVLDIRGGGVKNYSALGEINNLKAILLMDLRALKEIDFLSNLENLQYIRLDGCSNVEAIPSLKLLNRLKRVVIENMMRLNDICGVSEAQNIQELIVLSLNSNLKADNFICFLNHKTLRNILPGIAPKGSKESIKVDLLLEGRRMLNSDYVGGRFEYFEIKN
ncbi:MAG: hypothetical protein CSA42_01040 [Gammaproteobacteria bacterium]|nr:MAG: hypothetical protein CSA42_01040 [Gammaproteobacteria bacterium]